MFILIFTSTSQLNKDKKSLNAINTNDMTTQQSVVAKITVV